MEKLTLLKDPDRSGGVLVIIEEEGPRQGAWPIHMPREIEEAVGVGLDLVGSVSSFALGLYDEGYDVRVSGQLLGRLDEFVRYSPVQRFTWAYYLLGRAWIQGRWPRIKMLLQRDIVPSRQLAVLENTARYFRDRPAGEPLVLISS